MKGSLRVKKVNYAKFIVFCFIFPAMQILLHFIIECKTLSAATDVKVVLRRDSCSS